MSDRAKELKAALLALPEAERLALADAAYDSVEPDGPSVLSAEWVAEINRRVADLEAGRTQGTPAEDVFRKLRARAR